MNPARLFFPAAAKAYPPRTRASRLLAHVGERGARLRRRHQPRHEVDNRSVEIAVAHHDVAERDADAQLRQPGGMHASSRSSASEHATPGAFVTNITASPMRFTTFAPTGRDHVAGDGLEAVEHQREMMRFEFLPQPGVAGEIGETDRQLHDVQRRTRRTDLAVPTGDDLQMVTVQRVDRVEIRGNTASAVA